MYLQHVADIKEKNNNIFQDVVFSKSCEYA